MNNLPTTIDRDSLDRLRQKAALSAAIETWRPAPGDVLEGVIVGSRKVNGPFGEQPQALVKTPGNTVVAVWLTKWLLGQLRAQEADRGDLVSLTFHGRETSRAGAQFNRMSVVTLKAEPAERRDDTLLLPP